MSSMSRLLVMFMFLAAGILTPFNSNPATAKVNAIHVGIQAGHWKTGELPEEQAKFRNQTGTWAAGVSEVDVNLDIAQRVVGLLRERGIVVDLLPATVPIGYAPDVFVALHGDGSLNQYQRGFKAARPTFRAPSDPARDDQLVEIIHDVYGRVTGLPRDYAVSRGMTGYYAFGTNRYQHAVPKTVACAIIEMGFITNASDRYILTNQADKVAYAIFLSIVTFLEERGYAVGAPAAAPVTAPAVQALPVGYPNQGTLRVETDARNVRGDFVSILE